MAGTLVLMRHGKSGYPTHSSDFDRPLAPRGRREATLAGMSMANEGLSIDFVLCSSAIRTRETVQQIEIHAPIEYLDSLYGGTCDDVCEALRIYTPAHSDTVLVVGHEPGMPSTAMALDPNAEIGRFPTSAYAVLLVGVEWDKIGLGTHDAAIQGSVRIPRG